MANVTIKIYEENNADSKKEERLIIIKFVKTNSTKKLTSKRAGQILANEFPEFEYARKGMIKTDRGWHRMHSVKPTAKCSYHYIWRHAFVTEDIAGA